MALGDQSKRLYGFDTALLTLADTGTVPVVRNCLGIFSNLEWQIDYEMVENRAVRDAWSYQVTRIASWRAPIGVAVTSTATASTTDPGGYDFAVLSGSKVTVKAANVAAGTGVSVVGYSGGGVLVNFRHPLGEGGQVISFDIIGQGALTLTNAAPS